MLLKKPKTNVFINEDRPGEIERLMSRGWIEVDEKQAKKVVEETLPPNQRRKRKAEINSGH